MKCPNLLTHVFSSDRACTATPALWRRTQADRREWLNPVRGCIPSQAAAGADSTSSLPHCPFRAKGSDDAIMSVFVRLQASCANAGATIVAGFSGMEYSESLRNVRTSIFSGGEKTDQGHKICWRNVCQLVRARRDVGWLASPEDWVATGWEQRCPVTVVSAKRHDLITKSELPTFDLDQRDWLTHR